jgi:DNA-binding response OmpR family regulator
MLSKTHPTRKPRPTASPASRGQAAVGRELSSIDREVFPSPVVLVVSADGLLRWALYEGLVAAGFRVLTFHDEAQTREVLPTVDAPIALALVDDESWSLTQRGRDWLRAGRPGLPIILLAHPGEGSEERATALAVGILTKPFDLPHLIETVACAVRAATGHAHRAEPRPAC